MIRRSIMMLAGLFAAPVSAQAQGGLPPSTVPGSPPGFDYPLSLDSTTADPKNHHVIYEDRHVRTLEVTLWPEDKELMHGHAYPSFFVNDEPQPKMANVGIVEDHGAIPPFGFLHTVTGAPPFPHCMTLGPQTPHAATIKDSFPQHFWRMEFKKLDPAGFAANWRRDYPNLVDAKASARPVAATRAVFSPAWPFPIGYETVRAAPANFIQRYDDGHVRIVEAIIRPGETTPVFGSPYYAIEGYDTFVPGAPGGATLKVVLEPGMAALPGFDLGRSDKPKGLDGPVCRLVGPMPPLRLINTSDVPVHFYRFEILRVDGEAFRTAWRTMYPDMAEGPR